MTWLPSAVTVSWWIHCQICERRDLGGRGVLHEVVDRDRADAAQPRLDVADAMETLSRTPASVTCRRCERMSSSCAAVDVHVVALPVDLVRPLAEHGVELGPRRRDQVGVRHPGAVEAVAGLAPLVGATCLERPRGDLAGRGGSG